MLYTLCHRWIDEVQGTRCQMQDGHKGPCRLAIFELHHTPHSSFAVITPATLPDQHPAGE